MAAIDYKIVVASRKRPHNMARIQALLPTAYILVHRSEKPDYERLVPKDRLLFHDIDWGIGKIRQFMVDCIPTACTVEIDDDFKQVQCIVGKHARVITDPGAILQIIENSINVCADLEIPMFCWSRQPNPLHFSPHDPIAFNAGMGAAYGIIGHDYRFNTELHENVDMDLSLQCLLRDRIIFQDRRFYFDVGLTEQGRGGFQGRRTMETFRENHQMLKARWGKHFQRGMLKKRGTPGMTLRVSRRNPIVRY